MPFKIKEFREKLNLSQVELCTRAKISRQTLDLPIYGDLTSMDIELIAEEINKSRRKE